MAFRDHPASPQWHRAPQAGPRDGCSGRPSAGTLVAGLVVVMASVAAYSAALDLQLTPDGAALLALQWVWLEWWLDPQQTLGEATPLVMVASVAAVENGHHHTP